VLQRTEAGFARTAGTNAESSEQSSRTKRTKINDSDFDLFSSEHVAGLGGGTVYATHVAWLKAGHCLNMERRKTCARILEATLVGHNAGRPRTPPPRGALLTDAERNEIGLLSPSESHAESERLDEGVAGAMAAYHPAHGRSYTGDVYG